MQSNKVDRFLLNKFGLKILISLWLLCLWLPLTNCQDSSDGPSFNLLGPGHFHYHPYQSDQYLKEVQPTKQGPVVFPNDGPPPSKKPPLIVTSRPLIESIRRSELNPEPENNTLTIQPQDLDFNSNGAEYTDYDSKPQYSKFKLDVQRFHQDKFKNIDDSKPHFRLKPGSLKQIIFGRTKDYKPFVYPVALAPDAAYLAPHATAHEDYEDHSGLPPIYKAIADHAKLKAQKVSLKEHLSHPYVHPVPHPAPPSVYDHQTADLRPGARNHNSASHLPLQRHRHDHMDDDYPSDYAFSYKVRDHLTGDDFSHSQHSSGSATNGEYRVRLPDGRMQIVKYTADQNGYKADVRYDDEDKMKGNTLQTHDDYKFGGGKHDHGVYNSFDDNTINNSIYEDYKPNNKVAIATRRPPQPEQIEYKNYNHDFNLINSDYFSKNDYKEDNLLQNRDYEPIVVSENYKPVKESREEYNQYTDLSNEYNRDYSLEYDGKNDRYEPHQSKFFPFTSRTPKPEPSVTPTAISSATVRPLYEELKQIFVTKNPYSSPETREQLKLKVPSTTPHSTDYDTTTEHVVVIGTKPLYTNILNSVTPTQSYLKYTTPNNFVSNFTPSGYLVSTIANLKKGEKPVLSSSFIDRINKYLTFK